jgi:hypothetical protein
VHRWDRAYSFMLHDSFMCVWRESFTHVTGFIHTCDVTHPYVGHDSFVCGTWRIHVWDVAHVYVQFDAFICGTWLIRCESECSWKKWGVSYIWNSSAVFIRCKLLRCLFS